MIDECVEQRAGRGRVRGPTEHIAAECQRRDFQSGAAEFAFLHAEILASPGSVVTEIAERISASRGSRSIGRPSLPTAGGRGECPFTEAVSGCALRFRHGEIQSAFPASQTEKCDTDA